MSSSNSETMSTYAFFETNEIFEKDRIGEINEIISSELRIQPTQHTGASLNTLLRGKTIRTIEKKYIWRITEPEIIQNILNWANFEIDRVDHVITPHDYESVFCVGIECEELPYYQVIFFVKIRDVFNFHPLFFTHQLSEPFRIWLERFNGLSFRAYNMSRRMPRVHVHVVQEENIQNITMWNQIIRRIRTDYFVNKQLSDINPDDSDKIWNIPFIRNFTIPYLLSCTTTSANIFSLSGHLEQIGGGGELQTFGLSFSNTPNVFLPNEPLNVERDLRMFSSNVNVVNSVFGGINLHLFFSGLTTWALSMDDPIDQMTQNFESIRSEIQRLINTDPSVDLKDRYEDISSIQWSFSSINSIMKNTKFYTYELINEISTNFGIFGETEIPIRPSRRFDGFPDTLLTRTGNRGHLEHIAFNIKNNFERIMEKLEILEESITKMNNVTHQRISHSLQKTLSRNSKIQIGFATIIVAATIISLIFRN